MEQIQQIKSQYVQGQNMEQYISKARAILSADGDAWFIRKLDFFIHNFKDEVMMEYIEDLIENCLNLSMKHSMDLFVRQHLRFQQQGIYEKDCTHRKLPRPTTRWSGLPGRITFKFQCTDCHELLVNRIDGCRCPGLPYGEHDNTCNPDCHQTCVQRFGGLDN